MAFGDVKTLLASGNVLFEATSTRGLKEKLERGLESAFGFHIGVVLRTMDELRAMVRSDPFGGISESETAKLHVTLTDADWPAGFEPKGVADDFDIPKVTRREVFIIAHRKPDGTYLARSALDLETGLPKGQLVTARNWNTILKAIA
jgi:uncharacterized protein (DUF1697 family)